MKAPQAIIMNHGDLSDAAGYALTGRFCSIPAVPLWFYFYFRLIAE
jgi:hypothetical protein